MYDKKFQVAVHESNDLGITKDERYELIAQIAQNYNEFKESADVEEKQIWDSNDTELNFGEYVSLCN